MSQDTIFALSSGKPPAGIAVVRVSGPGVRFGLETLLGYVPPARRLSRADVRRAGDRELIDRGLAVFFPGPNSATGEDVAELHVHGGRAVVSALLTELGNTLGFRLAEPGEFTRRAFERGKIDLVEVEGLADLVAAETEMQRRQALRQAGGSSSHSYGEWREALIRARGMIEAEIDFADGEDLPLSVSERAWSGIHGVRQGVAKALGDASRGERLREGIEVVILGAPNAGKSSLLNWLARRPAAIVSPEAGTTRDLVEVRMDLGGFPLTLTDTAGLRESGGDVEREGIRRALERARAADLVLLLQDSTSALRPSPPENVAVWRVVTKIDLLDSEAEQSETLVSDFAVSTVSGAGMEDLTSGLRGFAEQRFGGTEPALVTRARQEMTLRDCLDALDRAALLGVPLEIVAEEVRTAGDALARLTGRIDVEDWLDVIFSEFCIGK